MWRQGILAAVLVLAVDQFSKWWLIGLLQAYPHGLAITPFFNLVPVWNRGVSFGIFNAGDGGQKFWLIGVAGVRTAAVAIWLARVGRLVLAIAIVPALGPGIVNAMIALSLVWWPGYVRLIESKTLTLKNET